MSFHSDSPDTVASIPLVTIDGAPNSDIFGISPPPIVATTKIGFALFGPLEDCGESWAIGVAGQPSARKKWHPSQHTPLDRLT